MSRRDLVSIIITNYNYGRFLREALDGALNQSYPEVEVIVVDDGSTDESLDICSEYSNRITIIRHARRGQPAGINAAFAISKGRFILPCDADDKFRLDKVERIVEAFEVHPDAGWVYHELDYIDAEGNPLPFMANGNAADKAALTERRSRFSGTTVVDCREEFTRGKKRTYVCPAMSGLCFRREVLLAILPIPEEIAAASDEYPKFAAAALYVGIHISEPLAYQRLHGKNASTLEVKDELQESIRYIRTAYYLRERIPQMAATTDRSFARFVGILFAYRGWRGVRDVKEATAYLKRFYGLSTWLGQSPRIVAHVVFACLRSRKAVSSASPPSGHDNRVSTG